MTSDAGSVFTPGTRVRTVVKVGTVQAGSEGEIMQALRPGALGTAETVWSVRLDEIDDEYAFIEHELEPLS